MVVLDMANTRLKDFLDIWVLAQGKEFRGEVVAEAIEATFLRRRTQLPEFTPVALTAAFHSASAKQTQWRAYLRKNRIEGEVPPLDEATNLIQAFVMPAVDALVAGRPFAKRWSPGGPWQDERIE
ncbi:MAG: nucleotidyl transferase AbiEii/AbiGii toxin family protein [Deltaproteobacteria bacterium]|nr:nucleotidyl transferase AbiEii/AbiGii toxin family protein [Deltaproteobacteria bacterium]